MRQVALLIGLLLCPAWVGAAPQALTARLDARGRRVAASFDVSSAITTKFLRKLKGGLKSTVQILTELQDIDGSVVGRGQRKCTLLYDIWEEAFFVSVSDDGRKSDGIRKLGTLELAIQACFLVAELPAGLRGSLEPKQSHSLSVRVLLNPLSPEFVRRSRQFMTNPHGGARDRPTDVLGAVAGLIGQDKGVLGSEFQFIAKSIEVTIASAPSLAGQASTDKASSSTATKAAKNP